MEYFSEEIVANIKHEQEENFIFDLSAGDKVPNVDRRELKIILKPFDDNWKSKAEKSEAYFVCMNCNFVDRQRNLICLQCKTNHETIFHDSKHLNEFGVKQEPDENSIYLPAFSPDLIGNPPTVKKESVGEEIMELKKKVEKAIICKYCDLKFPSCSDRKIHVAQVHNNWQCSQCPYKAQSKIYLTQHIKTHNKKFTCESCGQKFTKPRGLTSHQMQHRHGVYANKVMRKFKCENCKSSFATAKGLNDHNRNVHRKISGNFQCDLCGRTFKSRQCLRSHVQRHFKIPCLVCQHLMSRERLKDHMEENHSFKVSQCDICGKSFRSFKKLQQHTLSVHKVQKVQCDFCGKFCRNKTLLRQHVLVHVQVSCSFCGKLIKKYFLSTHVKTYHSQTESGPYKCLNCNYKTMQKSNLNRHMKSHTKGEKTDFETRNVKQMLGAQEHFPQTKANHKCPKCNYNTMLKSNLNRHIKLKSHQPWKNEIK